MVGRSVLANKFRLENAKINAFNIILTNDLTNTFFHENPVLSRLCHGMEIHFLVSRHEMSRLKIRSGGNFLSEEG